MAEPTPLAAHLLALKAAKVPLYKIADHAGVDRTAFIRWARGHVPKRALMLRVMTYPEHGFDIMRAYEATVAPYLAAECELLRGRLQQVLAGHTGSAAAASPPGSPSGS